MRLSDKLIAGFFRLPGTLRAPLISIVRPMIEWGRNRREYREGLAAPIRRITGEGVRMLCIGEGADAPYFVRLHCGDSPQVTELGAGHRDALLHDWPGLVAEHDVVYLQLHPHLISRQIRESTLRVPHFIRQTIDLPDGEDELLRKIKNRETQKDLNKIRNLGYSYEVGRDEALLDFFYHRCHAPYITRRHGAASYVLPYCDVLRMARDGGEVLAVRRAGEVIAGVLCERQGDTYVTHFNGIRDGDESLLRDGALAAVYYFSMLEALRRGCRRVDLGRTRPFLDNGILHFKKKWGGTAHAAGELHTELRVAYGGPRGEGWHALARHPLIAQSDGAPERLCGLMGVDQHGMAEGIEALSARIRYFQVPGLERLLIATFQPVDAGLREAWAGLAEKMPIPLQLLELHPERPSTMIELRRQMER